MQALIIQVGVQLIQNALLISAPAALKR